MRNPTWQYEHWRFRNDDGTLSTATWIENENTAATTLAPGDTFRLRVNFGDTNNADSSNTNISVKLQYNIDGAGWNDLTTTTSDSVYLTSSSQAISDGDPDTTQRLSSMTGSTFTGSLSEYDENNSTSTETWADTYGEFEFMLALHATNLTGGEVVEFRPATNGGDVDNTAPTEANLTVVDLSHTREPPVDELDFGTAGLEPSAIVANVREPSTASINIYKYVGLKLDGIPPSISVDSGAITENPTVGSLSLSGKLPTAPTAHVAAPPVGSLALGVAGKDPTAVVGEVESPTVGSLALGVAGLQPTAVVANVVIPGIDELVIAEQTPDPTVGVTVTPGIDELALSGIVPTAPVANVTLPGIDELALSGIVPVASVANVAIPDVVGLTLAEQTPTIDITVAPPVGSIALSGPSPTTVVANVVLPGIDALVLAEQTPEPIVGFTATPGIDELALSGIVPQAPISNITAPPVAGLTLNEQTPTVNITVAPPVGSLVLDGKLPVTVVANNVSPGVGALAFAADEPVVSSGDNPTPAADTLNLAGQLPQAIVANVVAPGVGSLALGVVGSDPTAVIGEVEQPTVGSLALGVVGLAPSVIVANVVLPGLDTLALDGKTPIIPSGPVVEVPTGSVNIYQYVGLKLDGIPPSVSIANVVAPDKVSLTFGGQTATLNVTVLPSAVGLSLSGQTPTLQGTVSPPTGSLTFSTFAPVDQDTVAVPVGSLTLTEQGLSLKGVMEPGTASLTLAEQTPTVDYVALPTPSKVSLTLAGQTPTIIHNRVSAPSVGTLTFTGYNPEVATGGPTIILPKVTLALSGAAPEAIVGNPIAVTLGTLTLAEKTPTTDTTVYPGAAALTLFSTTIANRPDIAQTVLTGQPVTIFYRNGTLIENPNATTSVPSNYEQCDYSGFRVLPGSLKMTWAKHGVRSKSWEERHPQDYVRSSGEKKKGSRRPEQQDRFIGTDIDTVNPEDL